jgi:hypothetical protein
MTPNQTTYTKRVRRDPKMKQQLDRFFQKDGTIQDTCTGPCTP